MKDKIYNSAPNFIQNLMVTVFNYLAYKKRYGGRYKEFKKTFYNNRVLTRSELVQVQRARFEDFIQKAKSNSVFYRNLYKGIDDPTELDYISQLPIVNKEMLRVNIKDVIINTNENLIESKTGGTTGKSLQVKYLPENTQERFAMLDDFRSRFGYELGKKTAWFSGKNLLTQRDIKKNRFWKKDYLNNVRYYSTFHIKDDYLKYYVEDLIKFQPKYLVGFPSTIYEIAKYGLDNGYEFPNKTINAVFPTAETLTGQMRNVIEVFFKTNVYDQYASSEGAPFIFECQLGNLHLEMQSGVYEVLGNNNKPSNSGRLVVTSFTTEGTPLIRYDIGDNITLKDAKEKCDCGNNNPLVKEILGRADDFVYSPQNGKINIINVANAIKDVKGIISYQIIQNELNKLIFKIIVDNSYYNIEQEKLFIKNWRDRVGQDMIFDLDYVDDIPVEKSGKFRVVRNNIKHLIDA